MLVSKTRCAGVVLRELDEARRTNYLNTRLPHDENDRLLTDVRLYYGTYDYIQHESSPLTEHHVLINSNPTTSKQYPSDLTEAKFYWIWVRFQFTRNNKYPTKSHFYTKFNANDENTLRTTHTRRPLALYFPKYPHTRLERQDVRT